MDILLVDDDESSAKLFAKRLEKREYRVEIVTSGAKALEYLDKRSDVLVLLDIVMPEMDGFEVLSEARKKYTATETPIIMMTARDGTEDVVNCLMAGANDYLTKPLNIEISMARIEMQKKLAFLQYESLKKKQFETINTMVATFNHEINNPLTIAMGVLGGEFSKITESKVKTAVGSMQRIADIVKKIEKVTSQETIEEIVYTEKTSVLKLK